MRKLSVFLSITILLFAACKSPPAVVDSRVKNPEFDIITIAVIQADLVNTLFEAVVKIDNPNNFAVELASINYKLYGNGKFWATGKALDILYIPANSSCETEFHFSMNFINMNRKLLDDVITMRMVNYRFEGDVEVEPVASGVSAFQMSFERSGLSEVKEKVEKKSQAAKVNQNTSRPSQNNQHYPYENYGNW